tara:strand:- start:73 stop:510 length:438 start_codon:yes stop_codon:yes gene_type:complete
MFQPTQIGALVIYHNRVDSAFQIFCTKELTTEASVDPLNDTHTKCIDLSWLEHKGHDNIMAEINLTSTDYWYNYALNNNAVQEHMHRNCADLNPLDTHEQRLHWIYLGHRQYIIEAMGVDTFYRSVTADEMCKMYGKKDYVMVAT